MKTPLYTIILGLRHLPLSAQIDKLIALAAAEKPNSIRRTELLALLQQKRTRDLRRGTRKSRAA